MKYVDGSTLAQMLSLGAIHLEKHAHIVDSLNVFPVPDGDTGTNMNLTCTAGIKEMKKNEEHAGVVATTFARGLLMGARGNSGVILSQLFRGFSKKIEDKKELSVRDMAEALQAGVETAYDAVMKPVEGTMLTVAKDAAKEAVHVAKRNDDFLLFFEKFLQEAKASLARTKELLPVLKDANVVDSGGQGLVYIYEGFFAALKGDKLPETVSVNEEQKEDGLVSHFLQTEEIKYGFCTEVLIRRDKNQFFDERTLKEQLSTFGDSMLVVSDEDIVKVHIHVEKPGEVLNISQRYGELIHIKIDNMREQHANISSQTKKKEGIGIVTVAMGEGMNAIFKEAGADIVIAGGQTMNPSVEDFMKAIERVGTSNVILLPNNKNVLMAAEEAAKMASNDVACVPSETIPQGIAALVAFDESKTIDENTRAMKEEMQTVKTGQVTVAVRDTVIDDQTIKKGDFIGMKEKEIVSVGSNMNTVVKDLCRHLIDEESELLTLYQGEEVTDDETEQLVHELEDIYPEIEIDVQQGGQPIYQYIISVE